MDKSKSGVTIIIAISLVIASGLVLYNFMSAPEYSTKHTALTHIPKESSGVSSSEASSAGTMSEASSSSPQESVISSSVISESSGSVSSANSSENPHSNVTSSAPSKPQGPININTADFEELREIKRIGPVLAQRIIDYRNLNGPFESWEELLEVKGIGEKTLEIIKEYACL